MESHVPIAPPPCPNNWHHQPTAGHDRHGQSVVYDDAGRSVALVYDGAAHGPMVASVPALLAAADALRAWFVAHPEPGALSAAEHFRPGCPNELAADLDRFDALRIQLDAAKAEAQP